MPSSFSVCRLPVREACKRKKKKYSNCKMYMNGKVFIDLMAFLCNNRLDMY